MKDYTIKHPTDPGKLSAMFAKGTNPLGFGLADNISNFSNTMGNVGTVLLNKFANVTGIDPSLMGLSTESSYSNSGGSYSNDGAQLTNISGTDRERFLAAAKSQIGYIEKANAKDLKSFSNIYNNTNTSGNAGHTKYAKDILKYSGPAAWCAFHKRA